MATTVAATWVQEAVSIARDNGDITVHPKYSGHGMYGKECFGVVASIRAFAVFLVELASMDDDAAQTLSGAVRADSMGLLTIYYFPGVQLDGDIDEEYTS